MSSWYKMHRGWMDNPAFRDDWDRMKWIWLIENAVWDEEYTVSIKNNPIKLKRGQLSYSIRFLAKAWGCNEKKVRTFLKHLKKWHMIDTQKGTGQTIVSICNYSKYQDKDTQKGTAKDEKGAQGGHKEGTNTKNNKEYKEYIYTDDFELFWSCYPSRKGSNPKKPAAQKFDKLIKSGQCPKELIQGAINYERQENELGNLNTPYVAQASTWLNQERWKEVKPPKRKAHGYQGM